MNTAVRAYKDAASFFTAAQQFLLTRPVRHNLILTLLNERLARQEPGRYWVAAPNGQVAGVVFQSPLTHAALLTPMDLSVITALADAMANSEVVIPGVTGEAGTAASFAGQWTELRKCAAIPTQGNPPVSIS